MVFPSDNLKLSLLKILESLRLKILGISRTKTPELDAMINSMPHGTWEARCYADTLLDFLPFPVFIKDVADLTYLRANKEACKLLGQKERDLLGKSVFEIVQDMSSAKLIHLADEQAASQGYHEFETFLNLNGETRRIRAKRKMVRDRLTKEPKYLIVSLEDVSHLSTLRRRVDEQEAFTQSLIQSMPLPVSWRDSNHRFLGCNNSFSQWFNLESKSLKDKSLWDVFSFEAAEKVKKIDEQVLAFKDTVTAEVSLWSDDYQEFRDVVIHNYPILDGTGMASGVVSVLYDISDLLKQKRHTRALHTALDHSSDSVILTNSSSEITYVNDNFTVEYGYSRHEIMGHRTSFLKSGLHSSEFYRDLWDTIKTGKTWSGFVVDKKKDGTYVKGPMTILPLFNGAKIPFAYIAIKGRDNRTHYATLAEVELGD